MRPVFGRGCRLKTWGVGCRICGGILFDTFLRLQASEGLRGFRVSTARKQAAFDRTCENLSENSLRLTVCRWACRSLRPPMHRHSDTNYGNDCTILHHLHSQPEDIGFRVGFKTLSPKPPFLITTDAHSPSNPGNPYKASVID